MCPQVVDGRVSQDIYAEFSTIMDRLKSFMYVLDYDMHPSGVTATLKVPEVRLAGDPCDPSSPLPSLRFPWKLQAPGGAMPCRRWPVMGCC